MQNKIIFLVILLLVIYLIFTEKGRNAVATMILAFQGKLGPQNYGPQTAP